MSKMTAKTAQRVASLAFGPSAQVKRHHEPRQRHKRFAIYFTSLGDDKKNSDGLYPIYLAGWGDSWESAFKMANENPFAQQKSKEIVAKRKELSEKIAEAEVKNNKKKKG